MVYHYFLLTDKRIIYAPEDKEDCIKIKLNKISSFKFIQNVLHIHLKHEEKVYKLDFGKYSGYQKSIEDKLSHVINRKQDYELSSDNNFTIHN